MPYLREHLPPYFLASQRELIDVAIDLPEFETQKVSDALDPKPLKEIPPTQEKQADK